MIKTFGTSTHTKLKLDGMNHLIISMPSHMCLNSHDAVSNLLVHIHTYQKNYLKKIQGMKITLNPLEGCEGKDSRHNKMTSKCKLTIDEGAESPRSVFPSR